MIPQGGVRGSKPFLHNFQTAHEHRPAILRPTVNDKVALIPMLAAVIKAGTRLFKLARHVTSPIYM